MIVVTFLTYGALDSLCIWSAALKLKFSFAAGGHVSLGGNGSSARVSRRKFFRDSTMAIHKFVHIKSDHLLDIEVTYTHIQAVISQSIFKHDLVWTSPHF